ncbi:MAG: hypothetical protein ACOX0V_09705 [Bacteroidales bacterium]
MNKIILFVFLSVFCSLALFPQTYQLPNGGFEQWDGSSSDSEPSSWNAFPSAQCDLSGMAALVVLQPQQHDMQNQQILDLEVLEIIVVKFMQQKFLF